MSSDNYTKETDLESKWQSLGISNDFIFYRVMRDNKDICLRLLQIMLPELSISDISFVETQKEINEGYDIRGVRLDAYTEDDSNRAYNIEMMSRNFGNIRKRTRYNQAMMDEEQLDKGTRVDALKEAYVIFISTEDLFGKDRCRYTFRNICLEEHGLELGDQTEKVIFYAGGLKDKVDPELAVFLDYVMGKPSEDPFVKKVEQAIAVVKQSKEARHRYMTVEMLLREERWEARNEGHAEGLAEGRIEEYIALRREDHYPEEKILAGLMERFSLDKEKAEAYLRVDALAGAHDNSAET